MAEMSEPTIRLATPEDAPALLAIYEPYVRQTAITCEYEVPSVEEFAGRIERTLKQCLVAMGITNMCALIAVPHDKDDEYLTHNSQDFHAHMGYRLVGAFDRCAQKFGRWYDMCWMELVLAERVPNQPKPTWFPDLPA